VRKNQAHVKTQICVTGRPSVNLGLLHMTLFGSRGRRTSFRFHQFLAQHGIPVLDHSPYSPDLAPADFFLFPRLKSIVKGTRFADVAAIQERVTAVLRAIPKEAFADSFQKLYECCQQ
jgi:hypothetical protein